MLCLIFTTFSCDAVLRLPATRILLREQTDLIKLSIDWNLVSSNESLSGQIRSISTGALSLLHHNYVETITASDYYIFRYYWTNIFVSELFIIIAPQLIRHEYIDVVFAAFFFFLVKDLTSGQKIHGGDRRWCFVSTLGTNNCIVNGMKMKFGK